jgi:hypothetical protein
MSHNPQLDAYQALFPRTKASVITTDFSKLEKRVMQQLKARPELKDRYQKAMYYGTSIHNMWDEISKHTRIETMPRYLFSFDPARNNQLIKTKIQTSDELQATLNAHPKLTHISCDAQGGYWLILKGPHHHRSAFLHTRWHPISLKRLPKPIRVHLLIDPLVG